MDDDQRIELDNRVARGPKGRTALSRRAFVKRLARGSAVVGGGWAVAALLQACSAPAPAAPTAAPAAPTVAPTQAPAAAKPTTAIAAAQPTVAPTQAPAQATPAAAAVRQGGHFIEADSTEVKTVNPIFFSGEE